MKINVIVNLQFEAIHYWSGANKYLPVSFLQYPHRHIFYIEAKKEVSHCNREIEIIMLKRGIEEYLQTNYVNKNIGEMSCEELAKSLVKQFNLNYCKVLEDNENGAEVYV